MLLYMKAVRGVNPEGSHHKKKHFISLILYLFEMIDVQ